MHRCWLLRVAPALALLLGPGTSALAQVARQGSNAASPQLQQEYQQAVAERGALQSENAQLQQHVSQLQQQLDAARQQQAATQQQLGGLQRQKSRDSESQQALNATNEKLQSQLHEVVGRYRELAQQLKDIEASRAELQARSAADARSLASCVDRNAQLYQLNHEVLDHLEHGGFWSAVKSNEPFVRLGRIRLENLADDYRQNAAQLRVAPPSRPGPVPGAASKPADALHP